MCQFTDQVVSNFSVSLALFPSLFIPSFYTLCVFFAMVTSILSWRLRKFYFNLSYFPESAFKVTHRCGHAGHTPSTNPPRWAVGQWQEGCWPLLWSVAPTTEHRCVSCALVRQLCFSSLLTLKWSWFPFFLTLESKIIRKVFLHFPSEKTLSFASQVLSTQECGQNHFTFISSPWVLEKNGYFHLGRTDR